MPNYPLPPYPPGLDIEQYDLLWQEAYKGKILLIGHADAQGPLIQGLLALGYLEATPRCQTQEDRERYQADIERSFDALASIPRAEWLARFDEAARLVDHVRWRLRQLTESTYCVSDAGYRLVHAWENAGRENAQTTGDSVGPCVESTSMAARTSRKRQK